MEIIVRGTNLGERSVANGIWKTVKGAIMS